MNNQCHKTAVGKELKMKLIELFQQPGLGVMATESIFE
jgi:hypothetical protein